LSGNHAGFVFGVPLDKPKRGLALYWVRMIDRVNQNIGIDKTPACHGSVTMKLFSGEFHALRVAVGRPQSPDYRINRPVRGANRISQKLSHQGIQTGATRLRIAPPAAEQFFINR
jgi:hypothetical protein